MSELHWPPRDRVSQVNVRSTIGQSIVISVSGDLILPDWRVDESLGEAGALTRAPCV
jgi:hypothetical protein